MNEKPPYAKWVGVVLGYFLTGSAHFLSGRRRAGLMWFVGLEVMAVMELVFLLIPGTASYIFTLALLIVCIIVWLVMLKQSYTPVRRIGVPRLLGVIAIGLLLVRVEMFLMLQCMMPYRVASGSMEPTLLGPHATEMRADSPSRPGFFQLLLAGSRFREIKVTEGGFVTGPLAGTRSKYRVGPNTYELPYLARPLKQPGQPIARGETLWSGVVSGGDCVVVNRLSYRFGNPQRGDLLAFETAGISQIPGSEIHLKRVVGLPGERIRIEPPYVIVDDRKLTMPAIFQTIASGKDGHAGYLLAMPSAQIGARLAKPTDEVRLRKDEYFVLGDNTINSLDSRYFGPVPKKSIIGKVARACWPFTRINALDEK